LSKRFIANASPPHSLPRRTSPTRDD
jgi:hypothetical protein